MSKEKPDFSGCQDPEFANTMWELYQLAMANAKDNPFLSKEIGPDCRDTTYDNIQAKKCLEMMPKMVDTCAWANMISRNILLEQNKIMREALQYVSKEPPGCDSAWKAKRALEMIALLGGDKTNKLPDPISGGMKNMC